MKTLFLTIIGLLAASIVFTTYAAGCWGWWDSGCDNVGAIPICQGNSCDPDRAQEAVGDIAGGFFSKESLSVFVTDTVRYFLSFVTLIGVVYVIYAGFQLMTGGGDEEKVKKARQIIIYVSVGIVVMWLSYAIVRAIVSVLTSSP